MGLEALKAIGPVAGALGGPVLSSLFAPEGQELSSFEGHGAIDPVTMLGNVNALIGRMGRGVADRAATPISLPSAYVQQPGVYSGGGLPMPIGVVGSDPALENPSLLNLQGMGEFQNLFNGLGSLGSASTEGGYVDPSGYHAGEGSGTDRAAVPKFGEGPPAVQEPLQEPSATRRKGYAQLVRGSDLLAEPDDMDRGLAAARLLLQNLPV